MAVSRGHRHPAPGPPLGSSPFLTRPCASAVKLCVPARLPSHVVSPLHIRGLCRPGTDSMLTCLLLLSLYCGRRISLPLSWLLREGWCVSRSSRKCLIERELTSKGVFSTWMVVNEERMLVDGGFEALCSDTLASSFLCESSLFEVYT